MQINIKFDGIDKAMKQFTPGTVRKAAVHSINRTADQTKTYARKTILEEYNIKTGKINSMLRVETRANSGEISATISGKGRGIPLSVFDAKQVGVVANKKTFRYIKSKTTRIKGGLLYGGTAVYGGEVTRLIKRSSGRKVVDADPKAFITKFKTGHIAVAHRGGSFLDGANAGVFALHLSYAPSGSDFSLGFRACKAL